MTFDEALSYLLSLGHETLTIKLGLANTETLLHALADPQNAFAKIQIAGTNGKGSTAVILDSICRAAGIRTGLFTSPHLTSITERIKINGDQVSEADFARLTAQVKTTAKRLVNQGCLETLPTFFEHVTAIALLGFRETKVELAILETGLGGRLDSTTAAGADIVAITPIAMDHEEYLGHTLAEIAAEKAAIIRRGVTAIVAPQKSEALRVILRQCDQMSVTPRLFESVLPEVSSSSGRFHLQLGKDHFSIGLLGRHQILNASTAVALAEALRERGVPIAHEAIIEGIETVTHPGRLELWKTSPQLLFDGAHNPAAASALREFLDEFVKQPITMIFGAMGDKVLSEMGAVLFPKADELILTSLDNPRAANVEVLIAAAPNDFNDARIHQARSVTEALKTALKVTPANGLICVTGSLYLIGAIQQALKEFPGFAHLAD